MNSREIEELEIGDIVDIDLLGSQEKYSILVHGTLKAYLINYINSRYLTQKQARQPEKAQTITQQRRREYLAIHLKDDQKADELIALGISKVDELQNYRKTNYRN